MNTIQMIPEEGGEALFLLDFDEQTNDLTFRSSYNPEHRQKEASLLHKGVVYVGTHFFPIDYLNKFIQ